jgi:hypothetical protein
VSGGYFLSGIVSAPLGVLDDGAKRTALALEATFDEHAATWGEPVIRQLPSGSWSTVSDCATLSTEAGLAQVTSIPGLAVQPDGGANQPNYYGTNSPWAGISAATNKTGNSCYWYDPNTPTDSFALHTVSGGAWMMDTLEFSAPIDVAGGTRAEMVRTTYSTNLYVSDGINCLVITTATPQPWEADAGAALLTALGG